MVSNKLSIRKYTSTIPSWCITPPPLPNPISPVPGWDTSKPIYLKFYLHHTYNPRYTDIVENLEMPVYGYNTWYAQNANPKYSFAARTTYDDWTGIFTTKIDITWTMGAAYTVTGYAGPYFVPLAFSLPLFGWDPYYGCFDYAGQISSAPIP